MRGEGRGEDVSSAVDTDGAARQQQTCVEIESSPVVATDNSSNNKAWHGEQYRAHEAAQQ